MKKIQTGINAYKNKRNYAYRSEADDFSDTGTISAPIKLSDTYEGCWWLNENKLDSQFDSVMNMANSQGTINPLLLDPNSPEYMFLRLASGNFFVDDDPNTTYTMIEYSANMLGMNIDPLNLQAEDIQALYGLNKERMLTYNPGYGMIAKSGTILAIAVTESIGQNAIQNYRQAQISGNRSNANTANNAESGKSVDDILQGATPGRITKGTTTQYNKSGGYDAAVNDFYSLKGLNNVKTAANGSLVGDLPDGTTVNVHTSHGEGNAPKLEILNPINHTSVKVRY